MSLNQKYTWGDFLKDNPEHKEKKTKRTSAEGKKAFEAAYKKFVKEYLAQRQEQLKKMQDKAAQHSKELTAKVQGYQKTKDFARAAFYQRKVGKKDAAMAAYAEQMEHDKQLAKKF